MSFKIAHQFPFDSTPLLATLIPYRISICTVRPNRHWVFYVNAPMLGMLMLVRSLLANAASPIEVTLLGIVTLVSQP